MVLDAAAFLSMIK